ncbi:MAG: hypothetical protein ACRDS1_15685, partial [Pseudonocardiaceae bacterium]
MGDIGRGEQEIVVAPDYPGVQAGPSGNPQSRSEIDMGGAVPGYWRRLIRRLTSDVSELDADDLCRRVEQSGARRAS